MDEFIGFEDEALAGRVRRLDRARYDLQERIIIRQAQAAIGRRWLTCDPLYQRLLLILRNVREDLRVADEELSRRMQVAGANKARPGRSALPRA
jgi:hypothetical protein